MSRGPQDAPLGAKPTLPEPTGSAAQRAKQAFNSYVEELREPSPSGELPAPGSFGGGRRYDVALSKLMHVSDDDVPDDVSDDVSDLPGAALDVPDDVSDLPGAALDVPDDVPDLPGAALDVPDDVPDATLDVSDDVPDLPDATLDVPDAHESPSAPRGPDAPHARDEQEEQDEQDEMLARPPPGAPAIRPPVVRGTGPEAIPQELLETLAETAMLRTDPDGTTSFEIAFDDALLGKLRCRITLTDGRVVALFCVEDANLRRLLEAETGRLRARLEERGLRVAEVRVEVESPAEAETETETGAR